MEADYSRQAEAYLSKQTDRQAARIKNAVNGLPAGDVKKIKGAKNEYRLRVGKVRVIFEKTGNTITVIHIDNRGDVYK